mmetsp:Transcript_20246/g.50618  ORF Transcript_20246/g.50618 Transcript_20246/m.50618 type:complete len:366 (-) Transcript_20246:761-1858(-)
MPWATAACSQGWAPHLGVSHCTSKKSRPPSCQLWSTPGPAATTSGPFAATEGSKVKGPAPEPEATAVWATSGEMASTVTVGEAARGAAEPSEANWFKTCRNRSRSAAACSRSAAASARSAAIVCWASAASERNVSMVWPRSRTAATSCTEPVSAVLAVRCRLSLLNFARMMPPQRLTVGVLVGKWWAATSHRFSALVMAIMTPCISPAALRSSKYMTMLAKHASINGRRAPPCHSMGGLALSRRKRTSISLLRMSMLTPIATSAINEGGFGPMPVWPHRNAGQPARIMAPIIASARDASMYSHRAPRNRRSWPVVCAPISAGMHAPSSLHAPGRKPPALAPSGRSTATSLYFARALGPPLCIALT